MACKEVKTIKNRKTIYTHVFVTVLLLTLLLSLLIGIVVAPPSEDRGKPDNKGPKPPPPCPKYTFEIWIDGPDIILVEPIPLTVEACADGCGWYVPPTNPRARSGGWTAELNNFPPWSNDECGKYTVNLPDPLGLQTVDAYSFYINRLWVSQKVREFNRQPVDFWTFRISWDWDTDPSTPFYVLEVETDRNAETEGTYNPDDDMWIVPFTDANFEVQEVIDSIGYPIANGKLSFTVTIVKGPEIS